MITLERVEELARKIAELAEAEWGSPPVSPEVSEDDEAFVIHCLVGDMGWKVRMDKLEISSSELGEESKVFYGLAMALGLIRRDLMGVEADKTTPN